MRVRWEFGEVCWKVVSLFLQKEKEQHALCLFEYQTGKWACVLESGVTEVDL